MKDAWKAAAIPPVPAEQDEKVHEVIWVEEREESSEMAPPQLEEEVVLHNVNLQLEATKEIWFP